MVDIQPLLAPVAPALPALLTQAERKALARINAGERLPDINGMNARIEAVLVRPG
jgi:hypothetical protein